MSNYTKIDLGDNEHIHQCNDCGAYADSEEAVRHHKTCKPGESKRWEEFYGKDAK